MADGTTRGTAWESRVWPVHRLEACATINFRAASPPLDEGGLFLFSLPINDLIYWQQELGR